MLSPTPSSLATHSVLVAGERLPQLELRQGWDSASFQTLLFDARGRFGHALCACRPAPLKLQIRLREGKYHLAVWPNEGPSHDSECLFFRDELADSASPVASLRAPVQPLPTAAPAPASQGSGAARLQVWIGPGEPAQGAQGAQLTSMRALAHRLWEAASLCRWHPTWTRDWGRTRYQMLQAAAEFSINERPAETLLFVPRPYREPNQRALNAEWEVFQRQLMTARDGLPRLLVAPVKRFGGTSTPSVLLRHLRAPIGLHRACHDFLARECRNVISNSRLSATPPAVQARAAHRSDVPEVIGFFSVEGNSRGGVWARSGWLLPVHPVTYVPAASSDVVMLIDQLLEGRHSFQYLITEAQASHRTAADWLLRHVVGPDGRPVSRAALEILNRGSSPNFLAARAALAQRMREQGIPTWTWVPGEGQTHRSVPPLPPSDQVSHERAQEALRQISVSPSADYAFGPSTKFFNHERKTA